MKKNYQPYLAFILSSFLMLSCVAYQPQMVDIPLIHEKNDWRVDASASLVKTSVGTTVSYGLTDKMAVQMHGKVNIGDARDSYIQGSGGYYKHFQNDAVLELYGGIGYGNNHTYSSGTGGDLDGFQHLYFSQLNFGKINIANGKIDLGIGLKTGVLFSEMQDNDYYSNTPETGLTYNHSMILGEPTAFIRFGGEHIKFNLKAGAVKMYQLSNTNHRFPFSWWNLGFGVNLNL